MTSSSPPSVFASLKRSLSQSTVGSDTAPNTEDDHPDKSTRAYSQSIPIKPSKDLVNQKSSKKKANATRARASTTPREREEHSSSRSLSRTMTTISESDVVAAAEDDAANLQPRQDDDDMKVIVRTQSQSVSTVPRKKLTMPRTRGESAAVGKKSKASSLLGLDLNEVLAMTSPSDDDAQDSESDDESSLSKRNIPKNDSFVGALCFVHQTWVHAMNHVMLFRPILGGFGQTNSPFSTNFGRILDKIPTI